MSDEGFPVKSEDAEKQPTSLDLARSWLKSELEKVESERKTKEHLLHFTETYEPGGGASRPSYVEPGSLDASDWDAAEWEEQNYDRQGEIDRAEADLEETNVRYNEIRDVENMVDGGDEETIEELANLEMKKREKEAGKVEKKQNP